MAPKRNPPKKHYTKNGRNPKKSATRVRGGRDPHDGDENYNWFTLKELQKMLGRRGAQTIANDEHVPARKNAEQDELEYGIPLDVDDDT